MEDLISVAEMGHFSRAAAQRNITQSAMSRRISALENWVGATLLDRSQHPIQLTSPGEEFIKYARDIVSQSYEGRGVCSSFSRLEKNSLSIASLHTLALNYVPRLVGSLQAKIGRFAVSVVAETRTIEEYFSSLQTGASDVFICYAHPSLPMEIDPNLFEWFDIVKHSVRPYVAKSFREIDLDNPKERVPYLEYSPYTYMSRVVREIHRASNLAPVLQPVYRASLAESLLTATSEGLGLSWLPETIVTPSQNGDAKDLRVASKDYQTDLTIRIYKTVGNPNEQTERVWNALTEGQV